jgi:hypothetical protein
MNRPLAGLRRRDRGNPCIDCGPKFGALVRIEAAQIVGESLHQPIGRQGSSPFRIVLTDDRERRRVVLRAGYLFGPVDRGLDRFDLIVTELKGLDPVRRSSPSASARPIRPNALAPTACRGVELDPPYVDVIVRRYEAATDNSAVLIETGETFEALAACRAREAAPL